MQSEDSVYFPTAPAEINKMIKEHGDMFSDSHCRVCSAVLNSESQKLTHYQSKKHANKLRRYLSMQSEKEPELKKLKPLATESDCNNGATDRTKACHLCNMTFTSPVMAETHYKGKAHAKNLRLKEAACQPPVVEMQQASMVQPKKNSAENISSPAVQGGENNNNPDRFCSICQASFNNPLMAQQHYVGKKHKKQMTKLKLMETYGPSKASASCTSGYPCTICNIELNSVAQYQSHISGAKHKNQVKKTSQNETTEMPQSSEQSISIDEQLMADCQYTHTEDQQGDDHDEGNEAGDYNRDAEDALLSEEFQFT